MSQNILAKPQYELIDNETGEVLIKASGGGEVLAKTRQYLLDHGKTEDDVSYVIIRNGAKAQVTISISGDRLRQLLEDHNEVDRWEGEGGSFEED